MYICIYIIHVSVSSPWLALEHQNDHSIHSINCSILRPHQPVHPPMATWAKAKPERPKRPKQVRLDGKLGALLDAPSVSTCFNIKIALCLP